MAQPITNLKIRDLVKDPQTVDANGNPIQWYIMDFNHRGYPSNSVTLAGLIDRDVYPKMLIGNNNVFYTDLPLSNDKYDNVGELIEGFHNDQIGKRLKKEIILTPLELGYAGRSSYSQYETKSVKVFLLGAGEYNYGSSTSVNSPYSQEDFSTMNNYSNTNVSQTFKLTGSNIMLREIEPQSGYYYRGMPTYVSQQYARDSYSPGKLKFIPFINVTNTITVSDTKDEDGAYVMQLIENKYLFKDGEEIKKYQPPGYGDNVAINGQAISSGDYGANRLTEFAFDGDKTTFFLSTYEPVKWIGYDFGEGIKRDIRKIIHTHGGYDQSRATGLMLKRSDDGVNWINVQEILLTKNAGPQEAIITPSVPSRYWSLWVTSGILDTDGYAVLELEMMEHNTGWETVGTAPTTKAMFNQHGMKDLSMIDDTVIQSLTNNQIEILCWTDEEESPNRTGIMTSVPKPQLIKHESDIILNDPVKKFTLDYAMTGNSILRLIASNDSGLTWHKLSQGSWSEIDSEDMEAIKANGITPEDFNNITQEKWKAFIKDSKVRFAYYMDLSSIEDELSLNGLSYELVGVVDVSPKLNEIKVTYDEITIEGRLRELEKLNAINIAKLNFKSNALIQSERYEMHDMIVDTCEEEDMIIVSSSGAGETKQTNIAFSDPISLDAGFVSELDISAFISLKKVEVI